MNPQPPRPRSTASRTSCASTASPSSPACSTRTPPPTPSTVCGPHRVRASRGIPAHRRPRSERGERRACCNLIDLDPLFAELIAHPVADAVVSGLLGTDYIVSNFTANIARPGSASMVVHSDLAAVAPEPWLVVQRPRT